MRTFHAVICAVGLSVAMVQGAEQGDADSMLIKDFESLTDIAPNNDGGTPPQFSLDTEHAKQGKSGLRVVYKNGTPGYGNLTMPAAMREIVETISVQVHRESAAPKGAMHLWLFEADGDAWLSPSIVLEELKPGWNQARVALKDFRFEKRGDGKPDLARVDRLLIGCNFAGFTITLDDLRYEGKDIRRRWNDLEKGQAMITIRSEQPVVASFLGFGVEWDPKFWTQGTFKTTTDRLPPTPLLTKEGEKKGEQSVTEQDWELVQKRMRWMKIPFVRMMMMSRWCTEGDGKFTWQTKHMQSLYRHLDVCQQQGIHVILTDWGVVPEWTRVPGYNGVNDPKYAAGIATYLDYLINERKYDCIRYFVMVNEPNFEAGGYDKWKQGILNVAKALEEKKLSGKVTLVGSDESGADEWHRNAVDQLQSVLGVYDIHRYATVDEVRTGKLQQHYQTQWQYALAKDPKAKTKPMIVGEAGLTAKGFSSGNNPLHLTYEYGMAMADYAVQAVNAGSWGVSAWMLDDSSHEGFTWGMWKNKGGGFALKPWFYTWALVTRYFPRGSMIVAADYAGPDVRVLAARVPAKVGEAWSILLVNRANATRRLQLSAPGVGKASFQRYVYARDQAKADADGFPVAVGKEEFDLGKMVEVECPAESVVLLTTGE